MVGEWHVMKKLSVALALTLLSGSPTVHEGFCFKVRFRQSFRSKVALESSHSTNSSLAFGFKASRLWLLGLMGPGPESDIVQNGLP